MPVGWKLLPNIAIFQERIERGHEKEELLSVTIGRGVIKQTDLDKKDSSTADKSKYLLVHEGDLVYSMRFRQGASGYSNYKGVVSPACTVLRTRKNVKLNPKFFHYMVRTSFYKNYAERYAYGIADGQIPLGYTDFKRMYSILPPLEEQKEIVKRVEQLFAFADKIETRYTKAKAMLDKLPQSILVKAFRGELVPQNPNDEPASVLLERIRKDKKKQVRSPKGISRKNETELSLDF
ncbi:MAG: restriction endonuclease subunit S [Flavobacteriales bacterium]|nr:restriction endonuclease subunit S [Flavobacteriales bacterium]